MAAGGSTLHSWMAKQIAVKNKDDHIDPRYDVVPNTCIMCTVVHYYTIM